MIKIFEMIIALLLYYSKNHLSGVKWINGTQLIANSIKNINCVVRKSVCAAWPKNGMSYWMK